MRIGRLVAALLLLTGRGVSAQEPAPAIGDSAGRVTFRVLPETVTV